MLKRCYSETYHKQKPSYIDCYVCDEWLKLSNFKSWMQKQDWEGKQLDKDILVEGNKVYSPETCVFVSNEVNQFIVDGNPNGKLLKGVMWRADKGKYLAQVGRKKGNSGYIGLFNTEQAAHDAYIREKRVIAHELASKQSDPRVRRLLMEM